MKHWIPFAAILALGGAAIFFAESRKVDAPVSPDAVLYFLADTQRELTRLPASATRLSDEEEIRAGREMARRYEYSQRLPRDADFGEVQNYVTKVGSRVALRAHRKLPYSFHYLPDPDFINAFALPGGPVFIGQGLMTQMDSEDELAAVLGHELEHIDHYHAAERLQVEARARRLGVFGAVAQLPIQLFAAGYSKDQEMEADREGTRLAVEAGYSPTGALRMFETFDRLYEEQVGRARTPQEELTTVALETLTGYFRSHPPASDRAAQIRQLMETQSWPARPERDLEVGYIFWTVRAQRALEVHRYPQAQKLAEQSLKSHPAYVKGLKALAQAQFVQADFAASAATDRRLLELTPGEATISFGYAEALSAAGDFKQAARDFEAWANSPQAPKNIGLDVPLAGLQLLAGDPSAAREVAERARASAPERLGNLGWWYYRAGQYQTARDLLQAAVQQRPGNSSLEERLGWTEIELRDYQDALTDFLRAGSPGLPLGLPTSPASYAGRRNEATAPMGHAVALWLADRREEALSEFARSAVARPEWNNAQWVKPLFSPLIADTVAAMRVEEQKRAKQRPLAGLQNQAK